MAKELISFVDLSVRLEAIAEELQRYHDAVDSFLDVRIDDAKIEHVGSDAVAFASDLTRLVVLLERGTDVVTEAYVLANDMAMDS